MAKQTATNNDSVADSPVNNKVKVLDGPNRRPELRPPLRWWAAGPQDRQVVHSFHSDQLRCCCAHAFSSIPPGPFRKPLFLFRDTNKMKDWRGICVSAL